MKKAAKVEVKGKLPLHRCLDNSKRCFPLACIAILACLLSWSALQMVSPLTVNGISLWFQPRLSSADCQDHQCDNQYTLALISGRGLQKHV